MTYLLRTINEGGRIRLRPLPYQSDEAGQTIITDFNVQGSTSMRTTYPVGTVFASNMLEMRKNTPMPFYAAGDIFPVSVDRRNLASSSHEPTKEMYDDYNAYMNAHREELNPAGAPSTGVFSETAVAGRELSLLDKLKLNPKYNVPTLEKDHFWVSEENWYDLILNMEDRENTLLIGPAGSGKTELAQLVADKLGIPCHVYDMGSMYDPISEMLGVHRISANGTSVFDYASFTRDIQEECVIVLDELNRATPAVNDILMSVLDNRRRLRVEMAGGTDQREIPVNPKCRFIATMNLGAEYTGVQGELDRALRDRFYPMELDYMPVPLETKMLQQMFKIPAADAENIVNAAAQIRSIAQKEEISTFLSTRDTIRAAKKVKQGYSALDAMKKVFLTNYQGTNTDGERAIVYNVIISK